MSLASALESAATALPELAAAIHDATGRLLTELPILPEKIFAALVR